MPRAYIIEVRNRKAGIIAGDEHGFRFFSSNVLSTASKVASSDPRAKPSVRQKRCSTGAKALQASPKFAATF
jgi:hypothetical protein